MKREKKDRKVLLVLLLAVGLAVAAGIMTASAIRVHRTTIYVYQEDYAAGTPIQANMFKPIQVDSKIVELNGHSGTQSYFITEENLKANVHVGVTLKDDVQKGQILMAQNIGTRPKKDDADTMNPDMIEMAVASNDFDGYTAKINVGCRVNIYSTTEDHGTKLLLSDVAVSEVGVHDGGVTRISFQIKKDQAPILVGALDYGKIYIGLVQF